LPVTSKNLRSLLAANLLCASVALAAEDNIVNFYNWSDYIGETTIADFEAEYGIEVNYDIYDNTPLVEAKLLAGSTGYDVVVHAASYSARLIPVGIFQPLDKARLPNWKHLDPEVLARFEFYDPGLRYGVPYMWGPNVLMYDTRAFKEAPKSWSVVFEETTLGDGKSNKGRVQAYDGAIHVADAANYLMYHNKELGIKDPYELNQDQYKAALDLLRQQRKLVSRYWHDAFIQMDDFKNEGVVASGSWPFQVNILQSEKHPVASTIPQEGATGCADTTMLHSEAKNPNCAYLWMEHTLSSNLQSDLSVWFGANPSVPAACTDGRGMQNAAGCTANGLDDFEKIRFWTTPVSKCKTQEICVPYYRWVSDYIGVIGGR